MRIRVVPLSLVLLAALFAAANAAGLGYLLLLCAVPAVAFAVLGAVGDAVDGEGSRYLVAIEVAALAIVVLAAAARTPLLALGYLPLLALQPLPGLLATVWRTARPTVPRLREARPGLNS